MSSPVTPVSPPATPREVFHRLVDGVSRLVAGDLTQVDRLAALYAERTHVVHPMSPLGDTPLTSREALRAHFAARSGRVEGGRLSGFHADRVRVHETADPEVVVAEFEYRGDGGGDPFEVPCVFVLRVRDGLIVESHDYIDHVAMARATGRLDALAAQLTTASVETAT